MNRAWLVPKPGLVVRDPVTGAALPEEGAEKPLTAYWLRRLQDGDASQGKRPKAAAKGKE